MDEPIPNPADDGPERTTREAVEWLVRRREGLAPADRLAYEAWLSADPARSAALDQASRAWAAVGELGATPELIALRRAALANAGRAAKRSGRRPLRWGSRGGWAAAAALMVFAAALGTYLSTRSEPPMVFTTAAGERKTVTLTDGSKVTLDEGTRVSVAYAARYRDLVLYRGQAEFEVAKDPTRPFSVLAGDRRVIATGTDFNVDQSPKRLEVTLLEGHVVVARAVAHDHRAETLDLAPSERLTFDRTSGAVRKVRLDAADAVAWKLGKLVFEAEPLDTAIARVNRYSPQKVRLVDLSQRGQTVSGVFDTGDVAAFAEAISAQLPLQVRPGAAGDLELVTR